MMFNTQAIRYVALLLGLTIGCTTEDSNTDQTKTNATSPKEDPMAATKTKLIWNAYIK
jgi:hypothetical protein